MDGALVAVGTGAPRTCRVWLRCFSHPTFRLLSIARGPSTLGCRAGNGGLGSLLSHTPPEIARRPYPPASLLRDREPLCLGPGAPRLRPRPRSPSRYDR